jgi:hypothetical protein
MVERHVETFKKLGFSVDLSSPSFPEKAILSNEILSISGEKQNSKWIGVAPLHNMKAKYILWI